jgi:protein regulator of cytokinesis 1
MTTEDTSPIEVQRNTARERRKEWRKNMSDRTFSLEDPPNTNELNISSASNQQDQSSFECRLEHISIYSWIESNFTLFRMNLIKRGLNEQDINDKEQILINNLKIYLQNLIEFEGKENELLQARIRAILDECIHLNRLLKLDYTIEKIENEELSLFEQLKRANDQLEKINQILKKKLEEINQLRLIEEKLCQKLDEKPIEFNTEDDDMPYDKRQEILEQHIQDLQNLQNDRSSSIEQARNQIHQMKIELDLDKTYNQPTDDNQVLNLIDGPVHLIELSKTNVQQLLDIAHELDMKYQSNRMKAEYLINTLHALYERLNLTDSDKYIKLPFDKPHRSANLILLEKEIDRCKELRRQNMRVYIENIRDEIFAQYEKCFYGREQMESFLPLYSNEFTEELLDEHEKELEEINMYYMHNEQLFVNLANWHEVWAEYREFQRQASDPDRFKRRGYSAVQEEKQRKHLEFSLKKVQDTVLQLSKEYEQEFGHQFLVEGVPVQDFFNHEKENYSQEKELEKARKQLARGLTPTTTHAQANIKRLEMSTKTPGRQQNHLGKEGEIKAATPFRPTSGIQKR